MRNGTSYPSPLRSAVDHAARFAQAAADSLHGIIRSPLRDPTETTRAERWLLGRDGEVLAFVADVIGDWHAGALDAAGASRAIEEYLGGLHHAMTGVTHAWSGRCCGAAESGTHHVHSAVTRAAGPSVRVLACAWRTPVTATAGTGH